ncbi:MAG: branched-chain amino acid aminotransferase [Myxococcales bacterium]|nr:MAG: branched-chain amino acid aminotransferase [Myxococcales bacterium]
MSTSMKDMDGLIWLNGKLVPWREAEVHVLSHALHYASSVFEGQRIYDGRVFALQAHIERLARSASLLGFELPFSPATLMDACREVAIQNDIITGYMRPIAWRGLGKMGVSARGTEINVAIAAWRWPSYFDASSANEGIRMALAEWRRPDPATAPVFSKAAGVYMIGTLAKEAAESAGFDDALLLDWRGRVAEATGANVFFVKDDALHTPVADCFLDGITRRTVMGLARARGWTVEEREIWPAELGEFEQCFLTGSAAEVTPVRSIEPHQYAVGAITRTLIEDYAAHVRSPRAAERNVA